jgi:hypothetical protein
MLHDMADYRTHGGEYNGTRKEGVVQALDWQPIINAVAVAIAILTPVAVTLLNSKINDVDQKHSAIAEEMKSKVDLLPERTAAAVGVNASVVAADLAARRGRREGENPTVGQ